MFAGRPRDLHDSRDLSSFALFMLCSRSTRVRLPRAVPLYSSWFSLCRRRCTTWPSSLALVDSTRRITTYCRPLCRCAVVPGSGHCRSSALPTYGIRYRIRDGGRTTAVPAYLRSASRLSSTLVSPTYASPYPRPS
ncbi:hypothetical protein GY45DRAFT_512161 [Cubamyces sp. BRFM 1775]|nr:hypothetical protein GY45DRAFT_512161 [Cubamyces sp. BRFM 1775]